MDNVNLLPAPTRPDDVQEQATYVAPAVIYEAPLEVRAGSPLSGVPDPLDLFGTNGD
jgi:hypothetical protein